MDFLEKINTLSSISGKERSFMMNNPHPISKYLVPGKRAHLVGIGGVSM